MWEPFIESSCFQLNILRKCVFHALDVSPSTVVSLNSSKQLNVNISEPFIEESGQWSADRMWLYILSRGASHLFSLEVFFLTLNSAVCDNSRQGD
uniref:Uncharacterized protein n=1 Tax=Aegilops tauschii subsp. strangulata TaxID=200361 RepID=A0A453IE39_AEGTS